MAHPRTYLTIVAWPKDAERPDVARILAAPLGTDETSVRLQLAKAPPEILGPCQPDAAEAGAAALIDAGGDGFAVTMADLEALGPTLKIKDLAIESGGVKLELWRGPAQTIAPTAIDVVVRARMSETVGADRVPPTFDDARALAFGGAFGGGMSGWYIGGAHGWAVRVQARHVYEDLRTADRRMQVSHKLDLHTTDGRVFQIDGDKFGYRILGDLRGHSDNVNIDRMAELISHLNPEVIVDPYFTIWSPPPGHAALRLPMMKINDDDPAFAFYSRWAALLYRRVTGTGDQATGQ